MSSVLDFDPGEVSRKLTLNTTLASLEATRGKINLLDTPGFSLFLGDATAACRVADAAVFVVSAATGIKFETETLWKAAGESGLPRMMVVTKLDRERTSLAKVMEDAEHFLGVKPVPIQVPIGAEASFRGVVDLLQNKARLFAADAGGKETLGEVPANLVEEVKLARGASPRGWPRATMRCWRSTSTGRPSPKRRSRALSLKVRTERAQRLLADGDLSVTQIAYRLGYTDVASFVRSFRAQTGRTTGSCRA